jgi:hypothetical protein
MLLPSTGGRYHCAMKSNINDDDHSSISNPCVRTRRSGTTDSIMMIVVCTVTFVLCIEATVAFSYSLHHANPSVESSGKDYFCDVSTLSQTRLSRGYHTTTASNRYSSKIRTALSSCTHFSRRDWIATVASFPAVIGSTPSVADDSSLALSVPVLCNNAISSWKKGDNRVVHLLGTAHVSTESAETAGLLVKSTKPNAVFVELDLKRVQKVLSIAKSQQLGEPADAPATSPSTFNPIASIQQRAMDSSANVVGNALRGLYKKLENEGIDAGQEFAAAIKEGLAQGATIVLGDQDVDVTLRRLTRALTRTNWSKLLSADESVMNELLPAESRKMFTEDLSNFSPDQFRSTVELVKTRENVRKIMAVVQDAAPEIYMAMVGERDAYMADGLNRLEPFNTIVAVVGLAHVDGIERYLSNYGWEQLPKPAFCRR